MRKIALSAVVVSLLTVLGGAAFAEDYDQSITVGATLPVNSTICTTTDVPESVGFGDLEVGSGFAATYFSITVTCSGGGSDANVSLDGISASTIDGSPIYDAVAQLDGQGTAAGNTLFVASGSFPSAVTSDGSSTSINFELYIDGDQLASVVPGPYSGTATINIDY